MRFDLTDLRLFLAVIDAGIITHGAAEIGMSLPAASERIRDMEATGEVVLLKRGRRGVVPTEAGEMLKHHARTILHQMAQMHGDIGQYAKGLRASVRIFANTAAAIEFLPERLAPWMAVNPHVDVDLRERESSEIARSVNAGFAEIGVLSRAVETSGLTLRPFAIDRLVAAVPEGHPLTKNEQLRFADLLGYHFIGLTGGALQSHVDRQASHYGVNLKLRIRLHSFYAICRMVGAGAGIGIVTETSARRYKRSTQISIIRLQDEWATRHLSLCVRDKGDLTPPAKALLDHLSLRVE